MNDDPVQLFLDSLSDNWPVSLAFFGAIVVWANLRGHDNAFARAIAGAMPPVAAGVLPYILASLWLAFVPLDGAMLLESDHWAVRILHAVERLHGALDWGVWSIPVTLLALLVTVRSRKTLARFNWTRQWQGTIVGASAVFLAFSPLGVRTEFWDNTAAASLKIELKPKIEDTIKTLAIAKAQTERPLDHNSAVAAMSAQGAVLRREIEAVSEPACVGQGCVIHRLVARQLSGILDRTVEEFGRAYGRELAATVSTDVESDDPRREAAAALLTEHATDVLIPGDDIGALVINGVAGGFAENVAGLLLAHLPLQRLVALRDNVMRRVALVLPIIDRLPPEAFVPDAPHLAAFMAKLEPVEHQIRDPEARPPLLRTEPVGEQSDETDPERRRLEDRTIEHAPVRGIR